MKHVDRQTDRHDLLYVNLPHSVCDCTPSNTSENKINNDIFLLITFPYYLPYMRMSAATLDNMNDFHDFLQYLHINAEITINLKYATTLLRLCKNIVNVNWRYLTHSLKSSHLIHLGFRLQINLISPISKLL